MGEFKFGRACNIDEVVDALTRIYERQFTVAFVEWLAGCPYGSNQWFVAREVGDIVGILGMLPCVVDVGTVGMVYRAGLLNNGGVVKRHRGVGLFTDLEMFALKEIGDVVNCAVGATNDAALKSHLAAGMVKVGELELLSGNPENVTIDMPLEPEPGFRFVHTKGWRIWRYSKPGETYISIDPQFGTHRPHGEGKLIYKSYEGRCQVMETEDYRHTRMLIVEDDVVEGGNIVDIWRMAGTVASEALKSVGFKSLHKWNLIVRGMAEGLTGEYRMDLCDNDSF